MKKNNLVVITILSIFILVFVVVKVSYSATSNIISYDKLIIMESNDKVSLDISQINSSGDTFNRYSIVYTSDTYIKGVITYDLKYANGEVKEEKERFFLEPKSRWTFSSLINGYIDDTTGSNVKSITFENIGDSTGSFTIHSFSLVTFGKLTDLMEVINGTTDDSLNLNDVEKEHYLNKQNTIFIGSNNVKLGLSLRYGGSINYISGNSNLFSDNFKDINLVNSNDNGRFIQQCYYGNQTYSNNQLYVSQDQPNTCNSVGGYYNPIQGGFRSNCDECGAEAGVEYNSKIVDIGISDDKKTITIVTKPSLWELNNEQYKQDYYDYYQGFTSDSYMTTVYRVYDTYIAVTSSYVDFTDNVNKTLNDEKSRSESPAIYLISALNELYAYNRTTKELKSKYEINSQLSPDGYYHFINKEENNTVIWSHWGGYFSTNNNITEGLAVYLPLYDGTKGYLSGFQNSKILDKTSFDITPNNADDDHYGVPTSYITPIVHLKAGELAQNKTVKYDYILTLGNIDNLTTTMSLYRNDHSYKLSVDPNGGEFDGKTSVSTLNNKLLAYWGNYNAIRTSTRTGYKFLGYFDASKSGNKVYDKTGTAINSLYWKVNPESYVGTNVEEQYQYTGNKDLTVYAQWEPITYTITYDLAGGTVTGNPTTYNIETETFTLKNPTRTGYDFVGWTGTNQETPTTSLQITKGSTGNESYTATWTPITYKIEYNLDGGTVSGNPVTYNIETTTFKLKNPTRTGYTFVGWKENNQGTTSTSVQITKGTIGNKLYTATWTPAKYTVTYELNGGISSSEKTFQVIYNNSYGTLMIPRKAGYTFKGWHLEPTFETKIDESTIVTTANDHTLYAKWELSSFDIGDSEDYTIKENLITNIKSGTKVEEFNINIDETYTIKIYDKNNNIKTTGILATSDQIKIYQGDVLVAEYIAVVKGDVNGDGKITAQDTLQISKHFITKKTIQGDAALAAGDINDNNKIDINDIIKLSKHIVSGNKL